MKGGQLLLRGGVLDHRSANLAIKVKRRSVVVVQRNGRIEVDPHIKTFAGRKRSRNRSLRFACLL